MIAQKHHMGCGIASVANILGINYEKASALFRKGNSKAKTTGFLCGEIVQALKKAGRDYKYRYIDSSIKNKIYKNGVIVFIKRSKTYPNGHYLTRLDNKWVDPWINYRYNSNVKEAKASIRKKLPSKPIYAILPTDL